MQCKKCKKEYKESELENGLCKECLENSTKISLLKKWWFWLFIVVLFCIIGFIILIGVAIFHLHSGIDGIALKVQDIDSEATLYTSAGQNIVIVEVPNYTDNEKSNKVNDIKQLVKKYSLNDDILSTYSTFILVSKLNSDTNNDSVISITTYSLPEMVEVEEKSKVYYDLVEDITNSFSVENINTDNSSNTNNTSATPSNSQTNPQSTQSNTMLNENAPTTSTTLGQKNALSKAKSYLAYSAFSYKGLIEQLEFEGFSNEEATYGADNCGADWNEQAAKKAKNYIDYSSFSRSGLIEQLEYEGFTSEQAEYGATFVGY